MAQPLFIIRNSDGDWVFGAGTEFPDADHGGIGFERNVRFYRTDLHQEYYWTGSAWTVYSTGGSGVNIEEVDGAPAGLCTTLKVDQADGLVLTDEGGGVFRLDLSGVAVAAHATSHQHGGSDELLAAITSPGAIGADQNDWAPADGDIIRASSSAQYNITGLAGGASGVRRRIVNVGSNNIILKHQSGSSAAANRFLCQGYADILLGPDEQADLWYDGTTTRWRAALV